MRRAAAPLARAALCVASLGRAAPFAVSARVLVSPLDSRAFRP
jgi:hypothetical protein